MLEEVYIKLNKYLDILNKLEREYPSNLNKSFLVVLEEDLEELIVECQYLMDDSIEILDSFYTRVETITEEVDSFLKSFKNNKLHYFF